MINVLAVGYICSEIEIELVAILFREVEEIDYFYDMLTQDMRSLRSKEVKCHSATIVDMLSSNYLKYRTELDCLELKLFWLQKSESKA